VDEVKLQAVNIQSFPQITLFTGDGVRSCGAGNGAAARGGRVQGVAKWEENVHFKFKKSIFCPQPILITEPNKIKCNK
jgi:hypothetical protein